MEVNDPVALREILIAAGSQMRDLCLRAVKSTYLRASVADRVRVPALPVHTPLSIETVDLKPLAALLYERPEVGVDQVVQCWKECLPYLNGGRKEHKRLSELVHQCYPGVPFLAPPGASVLAEMVQLLHTTTWKGCRTYHKPTETWFDLPSGRVALYRQSIEVAGIYRRLKAPVNFRHSDALLSPLGGAKFCSGETGSVLRFVLRHLPALTPQINMVFSAATQAGPQFEKCLTQGFDVDFVHAIVQPKEVKPLKKALLLIERSVPMPYFELQGLLSLPDKDFESYFKTEEWWEGRKYTPAMRRNHRNLILDMQSAHLRQAKTFPGDADDLAAAAVALELQSLIR